MNLLLKFKVGVRVEGRPRWAKRGEVKVVVVVVVVRNRAVGWTDRRVGRRERWSPDERESRFMVEERWGFWAGWFLGRAGWLVDDTNEQHLRRRYRSEREI
jgi:hypothetical protein